MPDSQKKVRRGFVMTGGGAKGLYEAGVIHAFHITGMEFDVITGSSIGAFNSVFFAEYLLRKKDLGADASGEGTVEAMDKLVKGFHHAWLQMPEKKIVDDSETGPLGQLKDDLLKFKICLPDLTRIGWWWTDPERKGYVPPPRTWPPNSNPRPDAAPAATAGAAGAEAAGAGAAAGAGGSVVVGAVSCGAGAGAGAELPVDSFWGRSVAVRSWPGDRLAYPTASLHR